MVKDGRTKGKARVDRGPPQLQEEIQHAWSVNSWRSRCSLPNKSVGSISRSQRRSAAYRAAQSSTPAESIGEPAVAPPPPPSRRSQSSADSPIYKYGSPCTCEPGTETPYARRVRLRSNREVGSVPSLLNPSPAEPAKGEVLPRPVDATLFWVDGVLWDQFPELESSAQEAMV